MFSNEGKAPRQRIKNWDVFIFFALGPLPGVEGPHFGQYISKIYSGLTICIKSVDDLYFLICVSQIYFIAECALNESFCQMIDLFITPEFSSDAFVRGDQCGG